MRNMVWMAMILGAGLMLTGFSDFMNNAINQDNLQRLNQTQRMIEQQPNNAQLREQARQDRFRLETEVRRQEFERSIERANRDFPQGRGQGNQFQGRMKPLRP